MANPVLERNRERFYRVLLDYGLRLTKPRRAMLDYLFDRPDWRFQAKDLYRELNRLAPGMISRATIYRTLDHLEEAGVVSKSPAGDNCWEYQLSEDGLLSCHYHLIDSETGRIVPISASRELVTILKQICAEHGFKEQYHVLQVYGEFKRRRKRKAGDKPAVNGLPRSAEAAGG